MGSSFTQPMPLGKEEKSDLQKETNFSYLHLTKLHRRFMELDKAGNGQLCRQDFMDIKPLSWNPLRDRVINAFFIDRDTGETRESVDFRQFIRTLAVFRPAVENVTPEDKINSRTSKLALAFRLLDTNADGRLTKDEIMSVFRAMVRLQVVGEEQLSFMTDMVMKESDKRMVGYLEFDDFVEAVKKLGIEERLSLRFLR